MARERSPERDKAKQMWLESGGTMKLKDIAAALSIGETQVRKWKSQDKWADDLNSNVTNESKSNVTKRGAPKGNKNAAGNRGGAPSGNQNAKGNSGGPGGPYRNKKALKHGIYETIFLDTLDEQEQALFDAIEVDTLDQLKTTLKTLVVSERRTMRRIKELEAGLTDKEKKIKEELYQRQDKVPYTSQKTGKQINLSVQTEGMKVTEITTVVASKLDKILKQEDHLNKVRDKKIRVLAQIAAIEHEQARLKLASDRLELDRFKAQGYGGAEGDEGDEDDEEDDDEW
ncbi:phage terminase small subunit-related protein [Paenibacillus peoriae]|uniref:phage terminase small subunit-related protein n=1 Tax=Paenibacillus peoriae TaxID=59893 RepID=UPI00096F00B8|nr:phage terminase small subunit-related protein [Paenibacillus peoriae]OMF31973.1 terminase [Paenibacillus peoriae]